MKEKSNRYAFNLAERKKVKILKGGELDFDNMNKGYYDELIHKDDKIKYLKKYLDQAKSWTIKESVYSNINIPQVWKNKLTYQNDVLKVVSKDNDFFTYLTKVNTNGSNGKERKVESVDSKNKNAQPEIETGNLSQREILVNRSEEFTPIKSPNKSPIVHQGTKNFGKTNFFANVIQEDKANEESFQRTKSRKFTNTHKKFLATKKELRTFTEKEKREILDHYKEVYPTNRKRNLSEIPLEEGKSNLPKITKTFHHNYNDALVSTNRSQMFKSSIYNLILPNKTTKQFYEGSNSENNHPNFESTKRSKSTLSLKNKAGKTEYGPFLNFNYAEYNKKIEIKNPEVKRVLEDIDYYGPYYSHCPSCRNKNLEFYQTMEPHNCLSILNYLKKTRKKNILADKKDEMNK